MKQGRSGSTKPVRKQCLQMLINMFGSQTKSKQDHRLKGNERKKERMVKSSQRKEDGRKEYRQSITCVLFEVGGLQISHVDSPQVQIELGPMW